LKSGGKGPQIGDTIYVPTSCSIDHGETDVEGGVAKIIAVHRGMSAGNTAWFVTTLEHPGHSYNYDMLLERQEELAKEFGDKRAYPDPDTRRRGQGHARWRIHSNIHEALAYFTDCQIATYQLLKSRTRTSKSDLTRQLDICEKMLEACGKYGCDPHDLRDLIQRLGSG